MDQFAFHDIPDTIDYILSTTHQPTLSYIGFSQGTAQAFATLSIHPTLNDKVDVFIALAPAMAPPGLASGVVSSFVKVSPDVLFLAFGRKSMLSSTTMLQSILYLGIFTWFIDKSLEILFGWKSKNMTAHQKLAAYPHLYSFTSTKSVVHWFQIIRNGTFQMYDDELQAPLSIANTAKYYKVAKFPTRNIKTPIVLLYGGSDSLVDITVMLRALPKHTVAVEVPHYEHLDFLWAADVHHLVFPHVLDALHFHNSKPTRKQVGAYKAHKTPHIPTYSEEQRAKLRQACGHADSDAGLTSGSEALKRALREESSLKSSVKDEKSPKSPLAQGGDGWWSSDELLSTSTSETFPPPGHQDKDNSITSHRASPRSSVTSLSERGIRVSPTKATDVDGLFNIDSTRHSDRTLGGHALTDGKTTRAQRGTKRTMD